MLKRYTLLVKSGKCMFSISVTIVIEYSKVSIVSPIYSVISSDGHTELIVMLQNVITDYDHFNSTVVLKRSEINIY